MSAELVHSRIQKDQIHKKVLYLENRNLEFNLEIDQLRTDCEKQQNYTQEAIYQRDCLKRALNDLKKVFRE